MTKTTLKRSKGGIALTVPSTLRQSGGSLVVTIPLLIVQLMGIEAGTEFEMKLNTENSVITLTRQHDANRNSPEHV